VKVLATLRLPGDAWEELADVEIGGLDAARSDVAALVVPNELVDGGVLDRFPGVRLVANYGVGFDRIDVETCRRRGVGVTNTPGVLDAATADLAFALILAVRRRVVAGDRFIRAGSWKAHWSAASMLGNDVTGATLGIVGLGRIGGAVARRAAGFDMQIRSVRRSGGDLDELLRECDIVTVHVPLMPETEGLLSRERLALMRDGATLVNTARGGVVDEEALVDELLSGRISAGLDVFAHEPNVPAALYDLPNVVLTPHLGSGTVETRAAMTRVVVDNLLALERGERPPNLV
jgi:glyoxylate reductase